MTQYRQSLVLTAALLVGCTSPPDKPAAGAALPPCLIDTTNESEELLGYDPEDRDWLASTFSRGALDEAVFWHAENEVVAMSILLHRRASAVWIWKHKEGLHKITAAEFAAPPGRGSAERALVV